jgi:hypothetical protein
MVTSKQDIEVLFKSYEFYNLLNNSIVLAIAASKFSQVISEVKSLEMNFLFNFGSTMK